MLVDLGTKALDPTPFCSMCAQLCGYAERVTTVRLDIENYVDGSYKPNTKKVTREIKPKVKQIMDKEQPAPNSGTEEEMIENLILATDKWEAAVAMQPEAVWDTDKWEASLAMQKKAV
jgi:hypothetical protein